MSDFYANVGQLFHDWNYGHPYVLYGLIRSMKPLTVVEVGCYRGFGSAWMAKALQENGSGHLYCIDNFSLKQFTPDRDKALAHFWNNLEHLGVKDFVTLIEGDSDKVQWPVHVDFAYIDGWHGYTAVQQDFVNCVKRGAECICFDDTTQSAGPRLLIEELRETNGFDIVEVLRDCGLTVLMCRGTKGPITSSQENPDHPGIDLRGVSRDYQLRHFEEMSKRNNVDYAPIMKHLHDGRA